MNKLSQVCNFCNNTSEHCCPESDKNYEAEQAKRERELREEDELFNNELARLGFGAMVWSGGDESDERAYFYSA